MARIDAVVLGAGIVGTSVALHLVKRGLSVALLDRKAPGMGTSYGNAGVIEGNTLFPHAFPRGIRRLATIGLRRATAAHYHLGFLPKIAPWLFAYRANTTLAASLEYASLMRPLFAASVAEHETLMAESGASRYLRRDGWIKVYREQSSFDAAARERALAAELSLPCVELDTDGARALEPSLAPLFRRAVHWSSAASVSNPLAVTRAYAARFSALGGVVLTGEALTLRRANGRWRVDAEEGPIDASAAVVALGPWTPDLLDPMGLRLPLEVKRGYHQHFAPRGGQTLTRPVVDVDLGYCVAPMEQGLRLTTGAEFAPRDAAPTPVQLARLLPSARELYPLGDALEQAPWLGSRPCFADSRPVIGRAPGLTDVWLACGHAHWGLTLGPVTGRLLAEMMTGATPFCDPAPYSADRF